MVNHPLNRNTHATCTPEVYTNRTHEPPSQYTDYGFTARGQGDSRNRDGNRAGQLDGVEGLLRSLRGVHSDTGLDGMVPTRGRRGGGETGAAEGTKGGKGGRRGCQTREAADSLVSAIGTAIATTHTEKRKRQPDTQIDTYSHLKRRRDSTTSHTTKRTNTAHDRHTDSIQPIQHTDCTTGQAHCTVVGMEIIQTITD